jgi:FAD/FMN-containing dehydrogenase
VSTETTPRLVDELAGIVGSEHVITDREEREYFSRDLSFERAEVAEIVVQPASTEELAAVVRVAHEAGSPAVARGGGMSYTRGFTPQGPSTVLIDMRRMDRIVEVDTESLYAVVECGCTWKQLYEELGEQGVRTPYFGPLSGKYATVGGALSQNSLFYGSGVHGTVSDSVLGLEVVLAGGEMLRTGSWARKGSAPFFRYNGPDLTGPFLGDTGALGIKARAALRLVPRPAVTVGACFAVDSLADSVRAMQEMANHGLAAEIYGLDPFYHDVLSRIGLDYLAKHDWSVHIVVDGPDEPTTRASLDFLRGIAARHGREIDPTAATAFRADPFGAVQSVLLGPEGELWLPIHAFLPYSTSQRAVEAVQEFMRENRETLKKHGIKVSYLTAASGNDFVFEPSFYWFDQLGRFRLERIAPEAAAEWEKTPTDTEARAAVLDLRRRLAKLFDELGGVHIQIGKYYDYRDLLEPKTWEMLEGIKRLTDPGSLINPGSLGLR